jgi:NADPH-dependent glutamate synthase beta subunit-like oxidoreductase
MMRVGVPAYRLPPEVVEREIDAILAQGVDLQLNHPIDDVEALLAEFEAVFVAIGAHAGIKLPIPGKDLPEVILATDFLRDVSIQQSAIGDQPSDIHPSVVKGQRVLVLGGGNVAIRGDDRSPHGRSRLA